MHNRLLTVVAVAAALLTLSTVACADLIWDNNGSATPTPQDGDGTWNNLGNYNWWNTSTNVQWDNANPTVAQLGNAFGTGNNTITVDAGGVTATGLVFKKAYTLQTGPVTLSGTAPVVSMPSGATSATTAIILSNLAATDGNSETADDLIVRGASATISGSYWKFILGSATVSPTNTYSGKLRLQNSALCDIYAATTLSSASTGTVVDNGSALRILAASGTYGSGQTLELSGYGFGNSGNLHNSRGALMFSPSSIAGDVVWAGNILLNATSSIASTQTGSYKNIISGVISGGFGIVKTSDAVLTLTNSNTYTGNTEIRRGGLDLNSASGQAINKNGGNLVFRSDLSSNAGVVNVLHNEQIGDGAEVQFNYTGTTLGYQVINLLGNSETVKGLTKSTATSGSAYVQNEGADFSSGKLILDTAGGDFSFNGVLRDGSAAGKGALALEKKGLGTQTLAGANTYSGSTLITAGGLSVTGSIVSNVTVQGGSLLGTGAVTGNVVAQTAGHVAPGTSIGTLTVTGNATLGGTLDVEYNSTTDAIDMLTVSGQLDLSGGTLSFSDIGPLPQLPLDQEAYIFAQYGSLVGSLPSVANLPSGYVVDYS